ncbi:lysophospholipid acyltransferase 7 [Nilaparvata lugens]|uniref:lysophospholipid acyltransferase 7 n=1 Tax=Nilaparvata lugens TaxID=108931 RepID=UPI000B98363A|nr:lysophospholipid acyltransferase 7 [Nilaparvata lugens]
MELDDIIYLLILFSCIGFGHFFRQIKDKENQKWIATGVGFLVVFLVSGRHILHPIFCTAINALIIIYGDKRSIHLISFAFTFTYLLFFRSTIYFGIPYPPAHTNLIQMILTLKLVGLAFEVHDSVKVAREKDLNDDSPHAEFESSRIATPGFIEIFHYAFCYIGVLTGPYFKYRMYWDLFNAPFSDNADCLRDTTNKLKPVPFFGLAFLISSYFFPLSYALSDEFYFERSVLYRLWYLYPSFFNFRMRMYIGMQLSECVFTMAGLGAYPQITEPKPGQGPTTEYTTLARIVADPEIAKKEKYSFEAIHNIDAWNSDFKPTIRSSMKAWNMTIQYWLAVNVYKRFPIKAYRMPVTFVISSLWHGVYAGYYLCLCSVPTYLPAEDIFNKNWRNNTLPPVVDKVWAFIRYWYKMLHFSYWSMAFNLLYVDRCFRYWASIYFIPNLLTIAMYAIGLTVFTNKKKGDRKSDEKLVDPVGKSTKSE